jgi:hypothetical protein
MKNPHTVAVVSEFPPCYFCGAKAKYDAKTIEGPWAFMCPSCFRMHTYGRLGVGVGQRLVLPD